MFYISFWSPDSRHGLLLGLGVVGWKMSRHVAYTHVHVTLTTATRRAPPSEWPMLFFYQETVWNYRFCCSHLSFHSYGVLTKWDSGCWPLHASSSLASITKDWGQSILRSSADVWQRGLVCSRLLLVLTWNVNTSVTSIIPWLISSAFHRLFRSDWKSVCRMENVQ